MQKLVKNQIIKWFDAGMVYPIVDSKQVGPVKCVPKKDGIIVAPNEKTKLVPMRTITRLRVCMDYMILNIQTQKDYLIMSFMDKILDHFIGRECHYFLDSYSGYNQISISLEY